MALAYGDDVVTEGGFGFDLGAEKFLDIKCRTSGLWPRGVMLVVTLRALKHHGGTPPARQAEPDRDALLRGFDHLEKHLESVSAFGLPAVVCVNRFPQDTQAELEELRAFTRARGVETAVCEGFARGGEGSLELADRVLEMLDRTDAAPPRPRFLYELAQSPEDKVRAIARAVYGAADVDFTAGARKDLAASVHGQDAPLALG
jgi:formate--tetrahydrofolate ligase